MCRKDKRKEIFKKYIYLNSDYDSTSIKKN